MKTKYLDTNIILRLIIKDNPNQLGQVETLLVSSGKKQINLFVSVVVILECEWVLRSFYKFSKEDISSIFGNLFLLSEITFEQYDVLVLANINYNKNSLGFEDNYHLAYCKLNKLELESFDKNLLKAA